MRIAVAMIGLITGLVQAMPAASAQGTDAVYSSHGAFIVHANSQPGRPIICYAATQTYLPGNRPFDTNLMFNGQDWIVTFPYSQGAMVNGGLVVDGIADAFQSEPLGDGYNGFLIAAGFVADLQRGSTFTLDIPSIGRAVFPLTGSSRALNDVRTCVRNGGVQPAAQPRPPAQTQSRPAQASVPSGLSGGPSEWGGFNIVGSGQSIESVYANVRGWQVLAASYGGNHAYCVATMQQNGADVRLGTDGGQWQLAVPLPSSPDWYGTLDIDGDVRGAAGAAIGNWTVDWLGLDEVDRLAQGSRAIFSNGRLDYDFSLHGSTAVLLKLEECQSSRGIAPTASSPAPSQPSVQRPTPNGQPGDKGILGSVWNETESGWQGTWTRLGNTNQFQAIWQHPNGSLVRADLAMSVIGNHITVVRRDTFGPGVGQGCNYNGMISGRSVSGHYTCDWSGSSIPWSATIQ